MARKIDKTVIIVSAVVGSLGLLSAILGFATESAKIRGVDSYYDYYGRYHHYSYYYRLKSAKGMRNGAAILLLASQIIVSAAAGFFCCYKSRAIPSGTKRIGIVCAVFSWILTVIAFVLLFLIGTGSSEGVFAGAGVITLITTALGITSFIMLRGQPAEEATPTVAPADAAIKKESKQQTVAAVGHPHPHPAPATSDRTSNRPGEQLPHTVVAIAHPHPQPAAGSIPNRPDEQPPHTVVAIDHPQSQPAAAEDTPNRSGPHTVVTTDDQPQQVPVPPQPQVVYVVVQPQQQPPNHAHQTLAQDEQRSSLTMATMNHPQQYPQQPPQVVYYVVQQPTNNLVLPQLSAGQPLLANTATGAQPNPQVFVPASAEHPPIDTSQFSAVSQVPVQLALPAPAPAPVQQGNRQEKISTVVRNETTKATISFLGRAMEEAFFPDSGIASAVDILGSMVAGSAGGDAGAAEMGDAAA